LIRAKRKLYLLAAAGIILTLLLAVTYTGLSVYKAYSYTTTPRQTPSGVTPADDGLQYTDVTFPSAANDGVRLTGWWIPNPNAHRVLILVHGRYENKAAYLALARPLWEQGYNLLLFDLRGHGQSTYVPSTYGIKEQWDVIGAARFAQQKGFSAESIGVIGWSLGGASTLMAMGSSDDFAAAVADSAYANSEPLLARNPLQPGLKLALRLVRGVDMAQVRPADSIHRLQNRSIMLIHGADDRAVPLAQERLLEQAGGDSIKATWIVPDAGHVQAYSMHPNEYIQRVTSFFDGTLR
jgi:dipeptidyl aminopeptidase/acylaminoacyl peptidase